MPYSYDMNAVPRDKLFTACMNSKEWVQQPWSVGCGDPNGWCIGGLCILVPPASICIHRAGTATLLTQASGSYAAEVKASAYKDANAFCGTE